ncbi:MAG TPA: hypothetical protein DC048_09730, partial [Planctomycetaceae bacterium]|nr:hypothetical protein [Planctomycetaceae bacterium]
MTSGHRRHPRRRGWAAAASRAILFVICALGSTRDAWTAEPPSDIAPADAWPLVRGSLTGTGRSDAVLAPPLAEAWRRDFEKTAFGAVPVIAAGTIFIGDLDGTFHALALADGATRWSVKVENAGFPSAAAVSTDP